MGMSPEAGASFGTIMPPPKPLRRQMKQSSQWKKLSHFRHIQWCYEQKERDNARSKKLPSFDLTRKIDNPPWNDKSQWSYNPHRALHSPILIPFTSVVIESQTDWHSLQRLFWWFYRKSNLMNIIVSGPSSKFFWLVLAFGAVRSLLSLPSSPIWPNESFCLLFARNVPFESFSHIRGVCVCRFGTTPPAWWSHWRTG
jgi:hypothetical protein